MGKMYNFYFLAAAYWPIEILPLNIQKDFKLKTMCTGNKYKSTSEPAKASQITPCQKLKFGIRIVIPWKMDIKKLGTILTMPCRMKC